MRAALRAPLGIAAIISMISCGGGGGGGSPAPELAQISAANQDTAARAMAFAVMDAIGAPDILAAVPMAQKSAAATKVARSQEAPAGIRALALRAVRLTRASASTPSGDTARPLAVSSTIEPCYLGGSFTVAIDDRDNSSSPTPGDAITLTFLQCRDYVDVVMNGSMIIALSSLSSTATTLNMGFTLTFQELSTIAGASSSALDGVTAVTYDETALTEGTRASMALRIEGSGMTVRVNQPGYFDTLTYNAGYELTSVAFIPAAGSALTGSVTGSLNGTFGSTLLAGKIALTTATSENFVKFDIEDFPHQGRVSANGRSNSALRITALDAAQVRIELDANGDGAYEATRDVGWATLLP